MFCPMSGNIWVSTKILLLHSLLTPCWAFMFADQLFYWRVVLYAHIDLYHWPRFSLLSFPNYLFICLNSHRRIAPLKLEAVFHVIQGVQSFEKLTVLERGLPIFSLWAGSLWMLYFRAASIQGKSILKCSLDQPSQSTGMWQIHEIIW